MVKGPVQHLGNDLLSQTKFTWQLFKTRSCGFMEATFGSGSGTVQCSDLDLTGFLLERLINFNFNYMLVWS